MLLEQKMEQMWACTKDYSLGIEPEYIHVSLMHNEKLYFGWGWATFLSEIFLFSKIKFYLRNPFYRMGIRSQEFSFWVIRLWWSGSDSDTYLLRVTCRFI